MVLSAHAKRHVQRQASELLAKHFPTLDPLRRNVLNELVSHTAEGWHLLLRADLPRSADRADAFLVGRTGVFAVVVADQPPEQVQPVLRHAEERFASIRGSQGRLVAPTAITLVVVGGVKRSPRNSGAFWALPVADLDQLFRRGDTRLPRRQADDLARAANDRLPDYSFFVVQPPEREPEPEGLLAAQDVTEGQLAAALERPFESWMTFLHPQQHAVVKRDYGGPARISGPAGTGKTVVALHRMRHVGRRNVGPLLFTTFVRTLPAVHESAFRQLAPELAERAEFQNLHSWARTLLVHREVELNVNPAAIDNAFARAWLRHRGALQEIEPAYDYWHTEVDRVIKGRGLRTLAEYKQILRRGRRLALGDAQRERVWSFYESYRDNLVARGAHDYHDMLIAAHAELVRQPLESPYAMVVVDEVQDVTLTGLRLLREIAGDGQNRLLLVGDGQQQVYPGGWRLSDAGIPVQGRGEVLKVNYRNRSGILDFARRIDAGNSVDDLDGAAGVVLRDAEVVNAGGRAETWTGRRTDLAAALVDTLRPLPHGHTALITFTKHDADECRRLLESAGVPTQSLEHHTGEPDDRVKVGTVHRAKGLDFRAVLAVQFPALDSANSDAARREAAELRDRQRLVAATRARDFLWWGVVEGAA
ncbi:UvrD-helicase domain-containing protein [Amycolatopsis rhabdoformis]|uniref:UvrD-helicase domain-containing protein n=1 Tax=Amycolatopsis rhabdoformis TaxID=1448059 RepID=A0ABZ1I6V5_9PSEU|nr:UvrD-helicase domain-containing protein [Amycolatopsis rhabdoformis]WSE30082.1 UvrD-helicase domain-containing protein [Amycolatopsis rhabdoformis]